MRSRAVAVLAVLAAAACASQGDGTVTQQGAAVDAAAIRQKIEAGNAGLIAAIQKGDSAAAASFYDDSAMIMPNEMAAMTGRPEIVKGFGGMLGSTAISNMSLQIDNVHASGDLAVETGRFAWTMTPRTKGAKPMMEKGKYVVVWKKQADGSYKLFRDIFNTDAPAAPAKK